MTRIAVLIVAAGRGTRAGGEIPKQWQKIAGKSVLDWTLQAFEGIGQIVLVVHPDDMVRAGPVIKNGAICVPGGATRDASVRAGLEALSFDPPDLVLIHDAARPLVLRGVINRVINELKDHTGAAPALAISDALWHGSGGLVTKTREREALFRAQTPQGFRYRAILEAHRNRQTAASDDVEVARDAGLDVAIVKGDEDNFKITRPEDFVRAERKLAKRMLDIRTGNGFDVHRFGPGDHVILCGVKIPHDRGLQGHSDADVGLHAITDAIYGALAVGDIGQHFPPSDRRWKGADSAVFLRHAGTLAQEERFSITHIDCTLICEAPKIGPHVAEMKSRLAGLLDITSDRIGVKATTSERLGFTGRGEGIACIATATLVRP